MDKVEYFNIPIAFDIETSSFYENGNKRAVMYINQTAIEDKVYIYRTWNEWLNFLNKLVLSLGVDLNHRIIIYVHNLAFEFQFIKNLFDWEKVQAIKDRTPMYAITKSGIEFRCSYLLSGYSLEKLGENLTHPIPKMVGDLDYSIIRNSATELSEKELGYCKHDVLIVTEYIREMIEQYGGIENIPLTKTGIVRNYVRRHTLKDSEYYKQIHQLNLEPQEYIELKNAFAGGFTHANPFYSCKTLENVDSIDFTSSYPAVMLSEKFPMSSGRIVDVPTIDLFEYYLDHYCCLFDITFEKLTPNVLFDNYLSESHCVDSENIYSQNGRVVSADKLTTTITDVDFNVIRQCYNWESMTISNFYIYQRGYLPKAFIQCILKFYADKTKLKGVKGKEIEYANGKGMLNSMYGMIVTDIVRDEITYGTEWTKSTPDLNEAINTYNKSKKRFLFYPWGVWVTAYARRNLWSGILSISDDYVYSDTDSIKMLNYDQHQDYINEYNNMIRDKLKKACEFYNLNFDEYEPKTIKGVKKLIGVWDFDAHYDKFKTLGAKRYMTLENGEYNITVSGLNKKITVPYLKNTYGDDIFDKFDNDLYIPKEYTGKLTHTYIDIETSGTLKDYQGHTVDYDEKSSVHLEPSDYSLNIIDNYISYLHGIRQAR